METQEIIYMLVALLLGTQLCRFIPLMLHKSALTHPILQKLNKILPLVIMILLVLTSLNLPKNSEGYPLFFAQIGALALVIMSYKWLKNILLSVGLGIVGINLLLWWFT